MLSVRRLVFLLVLCTVASGCTVKFAYNNIDRLVRWQVADYVDLDDAQAAYLDAELARLLYWHRSSHLPLYAQRAQLLANELDETMGVGEVRLLFEDAIVWADEIEARSMPMVIELMASLSEAQVAGLPEAFARSNAEFAEDELSMTLSEAQDEWRERVEGGMKYFAGRLSRAQRDYIATQSVRYQPEFVLWAAYRERWQAALLQALAGRDDVDAFAASYRRLVEERERFWGEEFTRATRANEALSLEVLHGLLAKLDDRQTARFQERLLTLAEDFRDLAANAEVPAEAAACLVSC